MATKSTPEIARGLFQKYYDDLICGLQAHLLMVTVHLYSKRLISMDSKDIVLDHGISQLEKCMHLLKDVEDRIKRDFSAFEKFCEVLCSQDIDLSDLGAPMLDEFQQLCPHPTSCGGSFAVPPCESQADNIDENMKPDVLKCENCIRIQAKCEKKLQGSYDEILQLEKEQERWMIIIQMLKKKNERRLSTVKWQRERIEELERQLKEEEEMTQELTVEYERMQNELVKMRKQKEMIFLLVLPIADSDQEPLRGRRYKRKKKF